MPRVPDALFDDGLVALASLLPSGYSAAKASLPRRPTGARHWLVLRQVGGKAATCQVVIRQRVEGRDVPGIARQARSAQVTTVVLAPLLSRAGRALLLAAGIGSWDLAGNASLDLPMLGLRVEHAGRAPARAPKRAALRSLAGEMAGRVIRALIDRCPPWTPAELAEQARVDRTYASRLLGVLADAGFLTRAERGRVETVAWRALLERWAADAPAETRGERFRFRAAAGGPDFVTRLVRSGLLHALTGPSAFALFANAPAAAPTYLYVDDVPAAATQLGLRTAGDDANVVLIEPADHSVFHRSREQRGLRCVSPSQMAVDTDRAAFASVVEWLANHEAAWRK